MRSFNLLQPPSITSGSSTVLEMERNGERGGDEMEIRRDLERDGERWREMERTWRELEGYGESRTELRRDGER